MLNMIKGGSLNLHQYTRFLLLIWNQGVSRVNSLFNTPSSIPASHYAENVRP